MAGSADLCTRCGEAASVQPWMRPWALPVCSRCRYEILKPAPDPGARPEEQLGYLLDLTRALGRVPRDHVFDEDLQGATAEQLPVLMELMAHRPDLTGLKQRHGSWLGALIACGALPEGAYRTSRGTRCIARDGHVCASLGERLIDDLLYAAGVPHEREPLYPGSRMRGDFLIGDTIVEFLGLAGNQDDDAKTERKRQWSAHHGVSLLVITPAELADRTAVRARLLAVTDEWLALPDEADGSVPSPQPTVGFAERLAAREQRAVARRTRMLDAGAIELSQRQSELLEEHGWRRDRDPRSHIGELSKDWETDGGVVYAFLDSDRRLHRNEHDDDTPAVDRADARREWWQHGERHRDGDRPAVEHEDGRRDWYEHGVRHRPEGPAVSYPDGGVESRVRGRRHRTEGPAVQRTDSPSPDEYWDEGTPIPAPEEG